MLLSFLSQHHFDAKNLAQRCDDRSVNQLVLVNHQWISSEVARHLRTRKIQVSGLFSQGVSDGLQESRLCRPVCQR